MTFARSSPYLTQLDGIGTMELEDHQRREMIARHQQDMIGQLASSSEYSAHALRDMNQPMHHNPEVSN